MSMNNKIFCTAPFTTLRIESYNNNLNAQHKDLGVVFKPGCVYAPTKPIPSLDQYLHGSEMTEHRHNLCHGDIAKPNCHSCSTPEKLGLQSIRLDLLKKPWASDQTKIYMLDIFFGNTCNLGCIMCGPEWSSFAAEERFKAGISTERVKPKNNVAIALDTMERLPDLKSVSFIGGEFFMFKDNCLILDQIVKRNIGCSIFTNATVLPPEMIHRLQSIADLEIQISVDGTAEIYEFIRYPASWHAFCTNVEQLKNQLSHAKMHFNIVVQPLNIQNLHEVYEWGNRFICQTHHQIITSPQHLTWPILLPDELVAVGSLLEKKQLQNYKITKKQKQTIDDLIVALSNVEHSSELRDKGVAWLSKLLTYRRIRKSAIQKVTGVYEKLGQEICDHMSFQQ